MRYFVWIAIGLALLMALRLSHRRVRLVKRSPGPPGEEHRPITLAMPAVQTCHRCQSPNPFGQELCSSCGEALKDKLDCLECGQKSPSTRTTCIYCGGRLES